MESTRFTGDFIEGFQERLPRVVSHQNNGNNGNGRRGRRRKSSCCSHCNSQIVCSYLIALISSSLVVGGVYLSIVQWNRIWLIISVSGLVLTLFGSCLYYCGTQSLINESNYDDYDEDSFDNNYDEGDGLDDDTRHFPRNQRRGQQNKNKRKRRRRDGARQCPPDFVTRSLSQLSLNMIPQYFSPADTSFIRIPGTAAGSTTGFNNQLVSPSTIDTVIDGANNGSLSTPSTSSSTSVPVSQIFSVNGQSYLILPLNGDHQPPDRTLLQHNPSSIPPYYLQPSSSSTTTSTLERGIPLENLVNLKSLPSLGSNSKDVTSTMSSSEKGGDINSFLVQLDPNCAYQQLLINNCDNNSSGASQQQKMNDQQQQFGTKINRKSLNRGRHINSCHGSTNIQDVPLPPTPSTSSSSAATMNSSSVPVSIIDHNPLARINHQSVTVNRSISNNGTTGTNQHVAVDVPCVVPIRSSSLRSSTRPLINKKKNGVQQMSCENGDLLPGQAATSNYFISFTPPTSDGKVTSGCNISTMFVPSSSSSDTCTTRAVVGGNNHNYNYIQKEGEEQDKKKMKKKKKEDVSSATSSAASFAPSTSVTATDINYSSSAVASCNSNVVPSLQRGDTFSRQKSKKQKRGEKDDVENGCISRSSSLKQNESNNLVPSSSTTSSQSTNLSTTSNSTTGTTSSSTIHGQQQQTIINGGNNCYLPLKEEVDGSSSSSPGIVTITSTSQSGNQRKGIRNHSNSQQPTTSFAVTNQDSDRERLIDLSSIESTSTGRVAASSSSANDPIKRRCDNDYGNQQQQHISHDYTFDGPSTSTSNYHSQVTTCMKEVATGVDDEDEVQAEHCHAAFASTSSADHHNCYEVDGHIYEDTEDLIDGMMDMVDVDDDSQFSPPPSYMEVIQDTQGINYVPAISYDTRIPSFINPINSKSKNNVIDCKVSNSSSATATDTSSGAIHSTGTL